MGLALALPTVVGLDSDASARPKKSVKKKKPKPAATADASASPTIVEVRTNVPEYTCTVDAEPCVRQGNQVTVSPGAHVIEIRREGYEPTVKEFDIEEGSTQAIAMALQSSKPEPSDEPIRTVGATPAIPDRRTPKKKGAKDDGKRPEKKPLRIFADSWTTMVMRNAFLGTDFKTGEIVEDRTTTGISQMFVVGYGITEKFYITAYSGFVWLKTVDSEKSMAGSNPSITPSYNFVLPKKFKIVVGLTTSIPVGSGGGNRPETLIVKAAGMGRYLVGHEYAVNNLQLRPELRIVYGEATGPVLEARLFPAFLIRTRGDDVQFPGERLIGSHSAYPFEAWAQMTFTAGYGVTPNFQPFVQFQYFSSITTQPYIVEDVAARDYMYGMAGVAFRIPVSETVTLRPSIAGFRPFNAPRRRQGWRNILLFGMGADF